MGPFIVRLDQNFWQSVGHYMDVKQEKQKLQKDINCHVNHTVGPIYRGGNSNEAELLVNAYRNSMQVALANGIRTIAFPSISTGVYSYPLDEAAEIAIRTVKEFYMQHQEAFDYVRFVLFDERTRRAYDNAIMTLGTKE